MKVLYIGQCELGSTSRMRFEKLNELLNIDVNLIDLTPIILNTPKVFRTIGWRFKVGPLISLINTRILDELHDELYFDIIWIDKGVFISPFTLQRLRESTIKLIHFTPDPAFYYHKSRLFENGISKYDYCITTKSFELEVYKIRGAREVIYCTQGYDKILHRPHHSFEDKKYDICFIGHFEKKREQYLQELLDTGFTLALAGIKWGRFCKKNKSKTNLFYFGSHISGSDYSKLISSSRIGLGLLSKWIPEKHTTRTIEIPACGTALLSERTEEIGSIFREKSLIYFDNKDKLSTIVSYYLSRPHLLRLVSLNGNDDIKSGRFSYDQIMEDLLNQVLK